MIDDRNRKLGVYPRGNRSPARDHPSKEAQKLYMNTIRAEYPECTRSQIAKKVK